MGAILHLAVLLQESDTTPSVSDTDRELYVVFFSLLAVSAVAALLTIVYWRSTGRAARARFEAEQESP